MIRRTYINNKTDGQIHLAETGQGPKILLIHQTPRNWDEFREVMELLSSRFHLVAMDLPGMGASTGPECEPTIEYYAAAAAQVIEHFGNCPVTICGHHTGGVVAIELAASRPDLVKSLVLSSTPWIDADIRLQRSKLIPIDMVRPLPDGFHLVDLWHQRMPYYPEGTAFLDRFMASALVAEQPAAGHYAVAQYHMETAAPGVECPILLVEHMQDPFAINHSAALQAAFPNAGLAQIPQGRVALEVTAPQFAEIVENWMDEQFVSSGQKRAKAG